MSKTLEVFRALLLLGLTLGGAQRVAAEDQFVAIKAKTVITATGEEFSPGMVVLRNGKVEAVGQKVELPPKALVIEAPNEVVMPGFVLARREAGQRRNGNHAELKLNQELFLRPGDLEHFLQAGFVAVALTPQGSGIPGQAIVVRPLEGELDALTLHGAGYLAVGMSSLPGDKLALRGAFKEAEQWIERVEKAKQAWEAKQKEEAAKAAAAKAAEAKQPGPQPAPGPQPQPTPAPQPAPRPQPVPGPRPRPRPRPVPKRAPLEELLQDSLRAREQSREDALEQDPARERDPRTEAARALGHDHDDPHAGMLPPLVGVDPLAEPAPAQPAAGAAPAFKEPVAPERVQIFVTYTQKPEEGLRLLVELGKASDYLHYLDGFQERKLDPAFYLELGNGQSDLFRVAAELGKARAAVLIAPSLSYEPNTRTERNLPLELRRAGCSVAFAPGRSLDDYLASVGVLVREGFDRTEAIQGMTSRPAELLGLGSELGALKQGLAGDLTFLSGDPFAPGTRVTRVMVGGEQVWTRGGAK